MRRVKKKELHVGNWCENGRRDRQRSCYHHHYNTSIFFFFIGHKDVLVKFCIWQGNLANFFKLSFNARFAIFLFRSFFTHVMLVAHGQLPMMHVPRLLIVLHT